MLIALESGFTTTYSLFNLQDRGILFLDSAEEVYAGMIVGENKKDNDLVVNVCKEKKLTNMRSSTADVAKRLNATVIMSLEEALEFISDDELVEVTPQNFRLRKMDLSALDRKRTRRDGVRARD